MSSPRIFPVTKVTTKARELQSGTARDRSEMQVSSGEIGFISDYSKAAAGCLAQSPTHRADPAHNPIKPPQKKQQELTCGGQGEVEEEGSSLVQHKGHQKPILLQGHERSITQIKYNREGDLLFTVAKDPIVNVWYSVNGERLGTYNGHTGAVWCVDADWDTRHVLTGSADNSCRLWDCETGKQLALVKTSSAVRTCGFDFGGNIIMFSTDKQMGYQCFVSFFDLRDPILFQTKPNPFHSSNPNPTHSTLPTQTQPIPLFQPKPNPFHSSSPNHSTLPTNPFHAPNPFLAKCWKTIPVFQTKLLHSSNTNPTHSTLPTQPIPLFQPNPFHSSKQTHSTLPTNPFHAKIWESLGIPEWVSSGSQPLLLSLPSFPTNP
uniref:Serine-threonine kinase receptor-associated protein n=1 Tax=Ficedula albicollis TaxID=59894 RepID=A0A803VZU6_FICAL